MISSANNGIKRLQTIDLYSLFRRTSPHCLGETQNNIEYRAISSDLEQQLLKFTTHNQTQQQNYAELQVLRASYELLLQVRQKSVFR